MRDDHAISLLHTLSDRVPIKRHQTAKLDDLDTDAFLFHLFRCDDRTLNEGAIRNDRDVRTFTNSLRFTERDHEVITRILRLVVSLSIEMLVLEKQDRIVRANRSAQKPVCVERIR